MEQFNELPEYIKKKPIHEILSRPEFSSRAEAWIGPEEVKKSIKDSYPEFNFEGLDMDEASHMVTLKKVLDRQSKRVVELTRKGKNKEALVLAREIKIVGDPNISIAETGIGSAIKATGGNLEMAASFLGFKDVENGRNWIEFIVRTWGLTPKEIVELD